MKVITLIFSIYLFLLSFIPCSDRDWCNLPQQQTVAANAYPYDNRSQQQEQCPPLCHCTCCSIVVYEVPPVQIKLPAIPATPQKPVSLYRNYSPQEVIAPIWQPPKDQA